MTAIKKPLGNTVPCTLPMWSSRGEDNSRTSSSLSKSSSSSSSQPHSPFAPALENPGGKTMEDVWRDINGSPSIQDGHHCTRQARGRASPNPNSFRSINLQEFLARPFHKEPPSSLAHFGANSAPPPPHPPVSFCLNTVPIFQYTENSGDPLVPPQANHSIDASGSSYGMNSPFDGFGSGPAFPSFGKKRESESEDNNGDRRHKRMIKNRESAARSRARKQSYTNELEFQVEYLTKENERLIKQHQQLCLAAAAAELPQKRTLQRTSTAPF